VRLGVLLPTFADSAAPALAAADAAAGARLDGVFAYDHLWPMGSPTRPSLAPFPVLSAVAVRCPTLCVGPLVARVGLVGTAHLVGQFTTLASLAPGRVVAALGTGDHLSVAENDAYGLARLDAESRRELLRDAATALVGAMTVWIGAGGPVTNSLAREMGATLNLWDASPEQVAAAAAHGPVSWAGPVRDAASTLLDELAGAGATWAVATPDADLSSLANWRDVNPLTTFH